MSRRALVFVALSTSVALCSCATVGDSGRPPVCDGKHRRTANPYGSVLSDAAPPSIASPVEAEAKPCGGGR
ncbi:hypothetical protein P7B02_03075 [Caulobacter segnis]|uniref:hypothetical protein n=1 Tax=Caulobacter segnis TaxID=88688 RepID=UPI00240FCE41|nr:hypothetical protein [Caulobacter segnis]MDG2520512.1 hypothetical protein [Caulobacter segnis]